MSVEIFGKVKQLIEEIKTANPAATEEIEQFRIKYVGAKNILKPLMGEIRNIANEQKREYGQLVNEAKQVAEAKFKELKNSYESANEEASVQSIDLTAPGEPMELGARHPNSIVMYRIIEIFQRMGFAVAEEREIEDDWHNFTAMNTPEDHPRARYARHLLFKKIVRKCYCERILLRFRRE